MASGHVGRAAFAIAVIVLATPSAAAWDPIRLGGDADPDPGSSASSLVDSVARLSEDPDSAVGCLLVDVSTQHGGPGPIPVGAPESCDDSNSVNVSGAFTMAGGAGEVRVAFDLDAWLWTPRAVAENVDHVLNDWPLFSPLPVDPPRLTGIVGENERDGEGGDAGAEGGGSAGEGDPLEVDAVVVRLRFRFAWGLQCLDPHGDVEARVGDEVRRWAIAPEAAAGVCALAGTPTLSLPVLLGLAGATVEAVEPAVGGLPADVDGPTRVLLAAAGRLLGAASPEGPDSPVQTEVADAVKVTATPDSLRAGPAPEEGLVVDGEAGAGAVRSAGDAECGLRLALAAVGEGVDGGGHCEVDAPEPPDVPGILGPVDSFGSAHVEFLAVAPMRSEPPTQASSPPAAVTIPLTPAAGADAPLSSPPAAPERAEPSRVVTVGAAVRDARASMAAVAASAGVAAALAAAAAAALALYQRVARPAALRHPARAALYAACTSSPFARTATALAVATGLARKTAEYHLVYLTRLGLLRAVDLPDGVRAYAALAARAEREPDPLASGLVTLLAVRPGLTAREAADAMGVPRPRLERRARDLATVGAIESRLADGLRRYYVAAQGL